MKPISLTNSWLSVNNWLIDHVLPETQWDITVDENLDLNMQGRYLMTCNHQSWGRYHRKPIFWPNTHASHPLFSPNGN